METRRRAYNTCGVNMPTYTHLPIASSLLMAVESTHSLIRQRTRNTREANVLALRTGSSKTWKCAVAYVVKTSVDSHNWQGSAYLA